MRINRAKSNEFALIDVTFIMLYFFRLVDILNHVDSSFIWRNWYKNWFTYMVQYSGV